jgi:excisionase family DNA binding protein
MDQSDSNGDRLLTIAEAAKRTGLSVRTLRRYQRDGRLAVVRVGRRVLCSETSLDEAIIRTDELSLARSLADRSWDDRSVAEWAEPWRRYFDRIASPLRPREPRHRCVDAIVERFGGLLVREYRLSHLAEIHEVALRESFAIEDVAMLLLLPRDWPVIEAYRELQARFSGRMRGAAVGAAKSASAPGARRSRDACA